MDSTADVNQSIIPNDDNLRKGQEDQDNNNNSRSTSQQEKEGSQGEGTNRTSASSTNRPPLNSRDFLCKQVEQLVSDINTKRSHDSQLIEGFKKDLEQHLATAVQLLETKVYKSYEETDKILTPKLEEFSQVIQRIATLEAELEEYKATLSQLFQDLTNPFTAEV